MKLVVYFLIFILSTQRLFAIDFIEIEKKYGGRLPMSISNAVQEQDPELLKLFDKLSEIIGNDFNTTVDTRFSGNKTYLMDSGVLDLKRYLYEKNFYNINLNIIYKSKEENNYIVEVKVYDVKSEVILLGKKYSFKPDAIRKVAHVISDLSYYAITGKQGYFQSKILFSSSDTVKKDSSKKSIYVIDQDGYGEALLVQGGLMTMPAYDSRRNAVAYVDISSGEPLIRLQSITNGKEISVNDAYPKFSKEYMTSNPEFCANSDCMFFTKIATDNSDIYKISRDGITKIVGGSNKLNTSPSLSPNDDILVYETNDGDRRNLHITSTSAIGMNRLLTGNDGIYAEPKWSPDGEWIAFTKLRNGLFHIGIIKPDGTDEQILYSSYMVENPTWMPNSDAILFSDKKSLTSKASLVMIDLSGRIVRTIKTSVGAVSPGIMLVR